MGNVSRWRPSSCPAELVADGLPNPTPHPPSHRSHWQSHVDLASLLHIEPTLPTTTLNFLSSGLDGQITGYREETSAAAPLTALNSTAVERAPTSYASGNSFVRGKSSYYPFRPGGLGDMGLDKVGEGKGDEPGLDALGEGLERAFDKRTG